MTPVAINPPAAALGSTNALLSARTNGRYESRFTGPLSIKTVIEGSAAWETSEGRFEVVPGSTLLLGDGEEYSVTVDALQPVETFVLFFRRGFVEDAWRSTTSGSAALLDQPASSGSAPLFARLQFGTQLVSRMRDAHGRMRRGEALAESFHAVALDIVQSRSDAAALVARLPALRPSTREELARRLAVATSWMHANLDRNATIEEAARSACLSPFHFHRLFTTLHGITPHRYLTRMRLERARALLLRGDVSVTDVAEACGFESLGSFSMLFRRTFGISPSKSKNREAR